MRPESKSPFSFLWGGRPFVTMALVIYLFVGFGIVNKYWPDSDIGTWVVIVVGVVAGLFIYPKRDRG